MSRPIDGIVSMSHEAICLAHRTLEQLDYQIAMTVGALSRSAADRESAAPRAARLLAAAKAIEAMREDADVAKLRRQIEAFKAEPTPATARAAWQRVEDLAQVARYAAYRAKKAEEEA